jgi:hypothetical protein
MGKLSISFETAFSHPAEAVFEFVTDPSNVLHQEMQYSAWIQDHPA